MGASQSLTMNVEFCEDNSGSSNIMRYFPKKNGGGGGGGGGVSPTTATDNGKYDLLGKRKRTNDAGRNLPG